MSGAAQELERAAARLGIERVGAGFRPATVVPEPTGIGAQDGFALVCDDPPVRVDVYVFERWGAGLAAGHLLETLVDGGPYAARSVVSGRLLLFGVADGSREDAVQRLERLVSSFQGTW